MLTHPVVHDLEHVSFVFAGLLAWTQLIDPAHQQRLRVPGQGMPGPANAPAGDLYVDIEVEADSHFERHGNDLGTRLTLSFAEAALGMATKLVLPDQREVVVKVEPGAITVCVPGTTA